MSAAAALDAWLALAPAERAARLAGETDPDGTLRSLGDECERRAASAVGPAIEAGEALLALAGPDGAARPRILRALTTALAYAGRVQESLAAADRAIDAAERLGQPVEAARARVASLHPLTKLGRVEEAMRRGLAARDALVALGQPKLAGRADINLGNIAKSVGDVDTALRHLESARRELADEAAMVAHVENTLGETYYLTDDFAAARAAFESAAAHFQASGQSFARAVVGGNLADLAAREGRLQDALTHFEEARRVLEANQAAGHLARVTVEEAEVLEALGAPAEALAAIDQGLAWLTGRGYVAETIRARLARARALIGLGRPGDAIAEANAARSDATARGDATVARRATLLEAELLGQAGDLAGAERLARPLAENESVPAVDRCVAEHHTARAMAARGDRHAARQLLDRAIERCAAIGASALLADLLVARASLADRPSDAIRDLEQAVEATERLRSTIRAERLRAAWTGSRSKAYESLALARLAEATPASLDAAFDAVERSKSRTLLDLVLRAADRAAPAAPRDEAERSLAAEFDRLRHRLSALYSSWDGAGPAGERRLLAPNPSLAESIRSSERDLDRISARLAAVRGERSLLSVPPSSTVLRSRLRPDERLVSYFAADGELFALVLLPDGITVRRQLAPASAVDDLAAKALFQMRRATRQRGERAPRLLDDAVRSLERLHAAIWQPLDDALDGARRIAVVPHGALHGVPFHALLDARDGRPVIDRFELRVAPSATLALATRAEIRSRSRRAQGVLVVGVADESAPHIEREARAILDCWPSARGLLGAEASVSAFADLAPGRACIHLACHGRFAASLPHASGLRLHDRWASVRELLDLSLDADLVVLAGCETGRAALEPGDEAVGLPRAFLAAGAASVVVSLWPVDDVAATEYMTTLHQQLAAKPGRTVGTVVREAMLELMKSRPHPAFWGAFSLVGSDPCVLIDPEAVRCA